MNNTCFGLKHKHECTILTVSSCLGSACSFCKTDKEFQASLEKANKRLASLDSLQQRYIAEKYYNDQRPWLEGGDRSDC